MSWALTRPFSEVETYVERFESTLTANPSIERPSFMTMRHTAVFEKEDHAVSSIINHIFENKREEASWGVETEFSKDDFPKATEFAVLHDGKKNKLASKAFDGLCLIHEDEGTMKEALLLLNNNLKKAIEFRNKNKINC